jgi:hypothetical protein
MVAIGGPDADVTEGPSLTDAVEKGLVIFGEQ